MAQARKTPRLGARLLELIGTDAGAQAAFAREFEVTRSAVAQWVTGASPPSDGNLVRIARHFKLNEQDLGTLIVLKSEELAVSNSDHADPTTEAA